MKNRSGFLYIVIAGIVGIAGSLWLRAHTPKPKPAQTASTIDPKWIELDKRLNELQAEVTAAPSDPFPHMKLADFFQKIGRADKTAEQLEIVAKLTPNEVNAKLAYGNALLALMKPADAEWVFRNVTLRWPNNVVGWQGLATSFYHQSRFLEAATTARVAISHDRMEPNGRYILATSLLEYALQFPDPKEKSRELKEAADNLRLVLGSWPEKGDIYYRLGRAYMELHDKKQTIKYFRRAMEISPDKPEIPWQLAQAYNMTGDKVAARKVLEEGLTRAPGYAGLHDMLGKILLTSGEPGTDQLAYEHFKAAVKIAPGVPAFQERYGAACLRMNKVLDAKIAFEKAQELDRNRIYPYQQLSAVYTRLGEREKASLAARTAVEMTFNDQQLKRLIAQSSAEPDNEKLHVVLSNRYQQLGMRGAAKDELLAILKHNPKSALAREQLSQLASSSPVPPETK
ncbi:MAG: tetratricopeptide repeat protein [Chthonomonadales bacterium]